jgi:steroid 5-alpha reductase family enzyme
MTQLEPFAHQQYLNIETFRKSGAGVRTPVWFVQDMDFFSIYFTVGIVILGVMILLWLSSLALKDSSIVDIFWGTGFVITTWVVYALTPEGFALRKLLLTVLVTIWGLRLSLHILRRNWGKPEDFRYQAWRKEAGASWWWRSLFKVFLLQGVLLWIIATPLLVAQISAQPDHLTWIDILAVPVWLIGFFFESVGDWQLARFKANPSNKGQVLQTGVWRYTRHPNYFGDATQWWSYYLFSLATDGWWTVFSPIIMTILLLRVSGVKLLEKTLKEEKPGYNDYIETTSEFIPWFPRQK